MIKSISIQSRRETRNSAKAAAMRKKKENTCTIVEDNKQKLMYVPYLFLHCYELLLIYLTKLFSEKFSTEDISKDTDSTSIMVLPKKRFRTRYAYF